MNEKHNDNTTLPKVWFWNSNINNFIPYNVLNCLEEEVKDRIENNKVTKGSIGYGEDLREDLEIRDSDIIIFNSVHWFSGILFNIGLASNFHAEWNFGIHSPELLQVAIYKENQHYTWHSDANILSKNNNIRKLTTICMLSKREDYSGGDLELEDIGVIEMNRGDIVVFPSFLQHRVTPVTSGIRKTATLWILGNRSF